MDVYWSPHVLPIVYEYHQSAYYDPEPLSANLSRIRNKKADSKNSWFSCPAANGFMKNAFIIKNPHHLNFNLHADGSSTWPDGTDSSGWCKSRTSAINDALTIDITMGVIFFAEKSLNLTTMPPFMHNTDYSNYGFYVPGTFDIGSWFRPVDFSFQLWPQVRSFVSAQGEPSIYVKFDTEEKVTLKRFRMTQEIYDLSFKCINFKQKEPKSPLKKLYAIFKKEGDREKLLSLIRENLY